VFWRGSLIYQRKTALDYDYWVGRLLAILLFLGRGNVVEVV